MGIFLSQFAAKIPKIHDYYINEQKNMGVVLMDNMTKCFADVFENNKGTLGMQYLKFLVTCALV